MINVLFGLDEHYAKYCATTIISILRNHKVQSDQHKIHFFFLGNLSKNSKERLISLNQIQPFEYSFLEVDTKEFIGLPKTPAHISSIATYNRLLTTRLLPKHVNKIIYLDCDLILNGDIDKIWNLDISNYLLAAVKDSHIEDYFNAGVIFLNLKSLRDFNFYSKWKDFIIKHPDISKIKNADQDILNAVITKGKVLFLPGYYNYRQYRPPMDGKMIVIHYCSCKPWEILCWYNKYLKGLYWQYTDVNPWKINSKINRFLSYIKSFKFLFNINRLIIFLTIRLFKDETRHRFREKFMRKNNTLI